MHAIRRENKQAAQAMLEFALILPLLLLVIFSIFAFGHFMFVYSSTTSASREAARYGSAVGTSENNLPRFEDCVAIRAAALRIGSFGGLREENIKVYFWDETTAAPPSFTPPLNLANTTLTQHLVGQCQDAGGNNVNSVVYFDPAGTEPQRVVGLGDRIEVRLFTNYVPIVPLVNLPSFPVNSFSVRTILRNVTVGTAPPVSGGGGGTPGNSDVNVNFTVLNEFIVGQDIVVNWTLTDTSATLDPTGDVAVRIPLMDAGGNTSGFRSCNSGNPVPITALTCTISGGTNWANTAQPMNITFDYPGDANFNPISYTLPVRLYYDAVVTLSSPTNPSVSEKDEQVNFTVRVQRSPAWDATNFPQVLAPQNTIRIVDAANQLLAQKDTGLTVVSGFNDRTEDVLGITFDTAGIQTLRASFIAITPGDYYSRNSNNLTHTINAQYTPTLLINPPASARVNENAMIGFYFDPATTPVAFPGNAQVTIQDANTGAICQGPVTLTGGTWGGSCSLRMTQPGHPANPGLSHTLNATYSGDVNYNPTSATGSITVFKGDSRITLTQNGDGGVNQDVRFTYTVAPVTAGPLAPSGGTVTVTVVGNPNLTCSGPAPTGSCTIRFRSVGRYQIQATYNATSDPNFLGSTSTVTNQNIVPCPTFVNGTATWVTRSNGDGYFSIDMSNTNPGIGFDITGVTLRWPAASENQGNVGVNLNTIHFLNPWSGSWNGGCGGNPATCLWPASGNNGSRVPTEPPPNTFSITCPGGTCRADTPRTFAANAATKRFAFEFSSSPASGPYSVLVNTNSTICPVIDSQLITR